MTFANPDTSVYPERTCQRPDCTNTFRSHVRNRIYCDAHVFQDKTYRPYYPSDDGEARVLHVTPIRPVRHDYSNAGVCRCGARVPNLPSYLKGAPVVCASCSDRREEYPR